MAGTKAGAAKALKTRLAKNPDVYRDMRKRSAGGPGKKFTSKSAAEAGKLSKRSAARPIAAVRHTVKMDKVRLPFINTEVDDASVHKPVDSGDK